VIDSPNQQDQDLANLKKMLHFIRDKRPKNSQIVLGLVDDCGVDFDGDVIELTDNYHLLQSWRAAPTCAACFTAGEASRSTRSSTGTPSRDFQSGVTGGFKSCNGKMGVARAARFRAPAGHGKRP
jgi:hypothetical protein